MKGAIEVTFRPTEPSVADAMAYDERRGAAVVRGPVPSWIWTVVIWAIALIYVLIALLSFKQGHTDPLSALAGFVLGVFAFMIYTKILHNRFTRHARATYNNNDEQRAVFTANGITSHLDGVIIQRDWWTVTEIEALPNSTGFVVNGTTIAVDDAFLPTDVTKEQFFAQVTAWHSAASRGYDRLQEEDP